MQIRRKHIALIIILLTITFSYWCLLAFNIPLLQSLWYWFWEFNYKPLKELWLIPILITAIVLVFYYIKKYSNRALIHLFLLIFLGYSIQLSFGLLEGRGINGLKDRLLITGHSEFARIASKENNLGSIASNYENLLDSNRLGQFTKSKPPGTLLTYMLFQKLSNSLNPVESKQDKLERFTTFASFWFPFICYLSLIPLYLISKKFLGEAAIFPCILYIFIPNVTLSTLNLDQALYPLLFLTNLLFVINAISNKSIKYAILSGSMTYISIFISFSLVPTLVFFFLIALSNFLYEEDKKAVIKKYILIIGIAILTFLIIQLFAYLTINYDIIERYSKAMQFHSEWKGWVPTLKKTIYFAILNSLEFACWIGLPIAIFYFSNIYNSTKAIFTKERNLVDLYAFAYAIVIIATALLGHTKAETARLWIFFVPMICFFAAYEIERLFNANKWRILYFLVFLQFITILIIKIFQDYH